jgi:hypothetical protein
MIIFINIIKSDKNINSIVKGWIMDHCDKWIIKTSETHFFLYF